jgi:hypothetical protein
MNFTLSPEDDFMGVAMLFPGERGVFFLKLG